MGASRETGGSGAHLSRARVRPGLSPVYRPFLHLLRCERLELARAFALHGELSWDAGGEGGTLTAC